jgi:hypothetical protein
MHLLPRTTAPTHLHPPCCASPLQEGPPAQEVQPYRHMRPEPERAAVSNKRVCTVRHSSGAQGPLLVAYDGHQEAEAPAPEQPQPQPTFNDVAGADMMLTLVASAGEDEAVMHVHFSLAVQWPKRVQRAAFGGMTATELIREAQEGEGGHLRHTVRPQRRHWCKTPCLGSCAQ